MTRHGWDHWSTTTYSTLTYGSKQLVVHASGHTLGPPLDSGAKLSEGNGSLLSFCCGDACPIVHEVWNGKEGG